MAMLARTTWLSQILRLMPSRVLKALDAWSYRVALKRAERRRIAATVRKPGPRLPAMPQYELRPRSD